MRTFTPSAATHAGATCYLNSLLQSLFMTPGFRRALYAWTYWPTAHGADESRCMARQLQRLFARMQLRCGGSPSQRLVFSFTNNKVHHQSRVESISDLITIFIVRQECCETEFFSLFL